MIALLAVTPPLQAQQVDDAVQDSPITDDDAIEEMLVIGERQHASPLRMDGDTRRLLSVAGAADDPLAALQSLPGVSLGIDDDPRPMVRGSGPGDNLYLIDRSPAAYVFHVFGNSIFNPLVIHRFDLLPATFGSRYGNVTGAVIDVRLREPRRQPTEVTFDYSLLRTGLFVETGVGERSALYLSLRRSLYDLYLDPGDEESGIRVQQPPVATDYQFKHLWKPVSGGQLTLMLSGAGDEAAAEITRSAQAAAEDPDLVGDAALSQDFDRRSLQWTQALSAPGSRISLILGQGRDDRDYAFGSGQFLRIRRKRNDLRLEYEQPWGAGRWITAGVSLDRQRLRYALDAKIEPCSDLDPDCSTIDADRFRVDDRQTVRFVDLFVEDEWPIDERWTLTSGLRLSQDDYLDERFVEPRLRLDYSPDDGWTLYSAAGLYHQFPDIEQILPQIGNPSLSSPRARHWVIGVEHRMSGDWGWKLELYDKRLYDQVLNLEEGRDADFEQRYSNDARGRAWGLELQINRDRPDGWSGWAALSLARSERINARSGEKQYFAWDRPVMFSLVAGRPLGALWRIDLRWKLQSGARYTPIIGLQPSSTQPGLSKPVYGEAFSERLPQYHRLDLRLERDRDYHWGRFRFYVDALNLYGQKNIQGYEYAPETGSRSDPPPGFAKGIPINRITGIEGFLSIGIGVTF